jgi:hypothetical protein
MKPPLFTIGVLILASVTLAGAVVQGHMSRRWGRSQQLQVLADRLRDLPTDIGRWRMKAALKLPPAAEAELECAGYVCGQYENKKTGEIVTAALLLGPAGPISVHTPDVCYSSQEYSVIRSPERVHINEGRDIADELWGTSLQPTTLTGNGLRVYYGWSGSGTWSAPGDARFAFAGQPYLYKIQVAGPLPPPTNEEAPDRCKVFLKEFLPAIRPYLGTHVKE